jgi:tetratricopeptide (TPR) repeat protein
MKKHISVSSLLIATIVFLINFSIFGQQTFSYKDYTLHFRQAKEYFDSKNYVAAKEEFSAYLESLEPLQIREQNGQKVLAEYYITMCTLYMSQPEAEILAERFIADNPEHPQAIKLLRGIGTFFYDNGDYLKAIKYLSKSSETNLEAKYKLAIAYYEMKDFRNAIKYFNEIKIEPEEEYAFAASYYAGILNFKEKRYADAVKDFNKAEGSSKYRSDIPNWIAMCFYHQGRFNELLSYAEPLLKQKNSQYRLDELSLLVAEVQFKLGYYEKAASSYQINSNINPQSVTNQVHYRYGFSLYKTNKFNESADELKFVVDNKDSLSQYAAFTLGLAQLKAGNLEATLIAFEKAKALPFNKEIQEEAAFNHAKVLLDLGKASETIYEIQEFNKNYPTSKFAEEANEIVADAFISSNNLNAAMDYLKSIPNRSSKLNAAYQTLSYNLAVKSYNSNKFNEAIEYFNTSISNSEIEEIKFQSNFGKAEALSQLKKYQEAIQVYTPLLINNPPVAKAGEFLQKVRIGLAYAYFNIKDFNKANTLFKSYVDKEISSPSGKSNSNVLLRLADTYLVSKKYDEALTYYTKAYEQLKTERDYALYQKGITLTYLNKETEAKQTFKQVRLDFPNSKYVDDAVYQENVISFDNNKYKDAIIGFTDLIENKSTSPYYTQALLKRAQSYANTNQHELSITDYKKIINDFPTDKTAKDALIGLQEELNEVGRPEEFGQLLTNFQKNSPNELENIDLEYRAAKGIYLGEKYDKAIAPLKSFIEKYPTNENITEATYLLADAAYRINNKEEALTNYKKMIEQNTHPQVNKAIQRSAEIELSNKNYSSAVELFKKFKSKNLVQKDLQIANNGLITAYLESNSIDSASVIVNEIITSQGISDVEKANIALKIADVYAAKEDKENETAWLNKVISFDKNDTGANSQLRLATQLFKDGKYKESSDMILDKFRSTFAEASDSILGKAYILLADNFVELKNIPQAKATLKSIIDNSSDSAVIEIAKLKLTALPIK